MSAHAYHPAQPLPASVPTYGRSRRSTLMDARTNVPHAGSRGRARKARYRVSDALVDLAIFALYAVTGAMVGSLFVYGTWSR